MKAVLCSRLIICWIIPVFSDAFAPNNLSQRHDAAVVVVEPNSSSVHLHSKQAIPRRMMMISHHTTVLSQKRSPEEEESSTLMEDLLGDADFLEIRLDATICACFVLARILVYDVNLPLKSTPGYELSDLILLSNALSSAMTLAVYWTMAGLLMRNFQNSGFDFGKLLRTTTLAGPLWLGTEVLFQWLPSKALDAPGVVETILAGSLGLLAVMSLCRAATSGWQ